MAMTAVELLELRCRTCGILIGYRRNPGQFVTWCSLVCADTPSAKFPDLQVRDEVAVELYLQGVGVSAISKVTGDSYQLIQQIVARRGIGPVERDVS